jgi:hypothetical protein
MGPEKRLPGETNADYERRNDPNAEFIGTQSLHGGGDPFIVSRALRALVFWRQRRRVRRRRSPS